MALLFQFTLLLIGLILLWKTGDLCVRHALGFSSVFGIHQFTVGFFIFAISTGLPEISATVVSTITQVPELSVGTLLGSTFVNLSLILGILCLLQAQIAVSPILRTRLYKVMAVITLISIWLAVLPPIGLWNSAILIGMYIASIFWFQAGLPEEEAKLEIQEVKEEAAKEEKKAWISPKIDISLKLLGSLGLLLISSWISVHAASNLSNLLKLDLTTIGGTLIAVGTSLPELALETHAVRRKEYALALGDLFGSSLLNISFILGILMLINPGLQLIFIWKLLPFLGAVLIWILQALMRKQAFLRKDGYLFLGIFIIYTIVIFIV